MEPSLLLVTPNQQDHGVPGLKAKLYSAVPEKQKSFDDYSCWIDYLQL